MAHWTLRCFRAGFSRFGALNFPTGLLFIVGLSCVCRR